MSLAAGKLRHRVRFERLVESRSPTGERTKSWNAVATVWAAIRPVRTREFIAGDQVQAKVTTEITIRYRDDIDAAMRAVHRSRIYNIEGLLPDRDSGREYLVLPCSSGASSG